jgi:hypothetical protein
MKRAVLISALIIVLVIAGGVTTCVVNMRPMGESHIEEWIQSGSFYVDQVTAYQAAHDGQLPAPDSMHLDPDHPVEGCRSLTMQPIPRDSGPAHFRLTFMIHLREFMIYDSRDGIDRDDDNYGTFVQRGNWVYTRD